MEIPKITIYINDNQNNQYQNVSKVFERKLLYCQYISKPVFLLGDSIYPYGRCQSANTFETS